MYVSLRTWKQWKHNSAPQNAFFLIYHHYKKKCKTADRTPWSIFDSPDDTRRFSICKKSMGECDLHVGPAWETLVCIFLEMHNQKVNPEARKKNWHQAAKSHRHHVRFLSQASSSSYKSMRQSTTAAVALQPCCFCYISYISKYPFGKAGFMRTSTMTAGSSNISVKVICFEFPALYLNLLKSKLSFLCFWQTAAEVNVGHLSFMNNYWMLLYMSLRPVLLKVSGIWCFSRKSQVGSCSLSSSSLPLL